MGSKNYRLLIFLGLIAFVWNGCKPDEDVVPDTFTGAKVLIANQGNFGWEKVRFPSTMKSLKR